MRNHGSQCAHCLVQFAHCVVIDNPMLLNATLAQVTSQVTWFTMNKQRVTQNNCTEQCTPASRTICILAFHMATELALTMRGTVEQEIEENNENRSERERDKTKR
eukprot:296923-Amphidinium_carterae.1